jgi:hypothetical protein
MIETQSHEDTKKILENPLSYKIILQVFGWIYQSILVIGKSRGGGGRVITLILSFVSLRLCVSVNK